MQSPSNPPPPADLSLHSDGPPALEPRPGDLQTESCPPQRPGLRNRLLRSLGWNLLNLWLVYHLLAVVAAPLSVPPTSPIFQNAWRPVGLYVSALYLNHGYHYFAPEPAGANLLGFTLEYADGRIESGRLPNLGIQPRLLYHRYFMLTEQLQAFDEPGFDPKLQEKWCRTYALALGQEHGAARVSLSRVQHRLPTMERIRSGGKLDDSDLYIEEPLGTWECAAR